MLKAKKMKARAVAKAKALKIAREKFESRKKQKAVLHPPKASDENSKKDKTEKVDSDKKDEILKQCILNNTQENSKQTEEIQLQKNKVSEKENELLKEKKRVEELEHKIKEQEEREKQRDLEV